MDYYCTDDTTDVTIHKEPQKLRDVGNKKLNWQIHTVGSILSAKPLPGKDEVPFWLPPGYQEHHWSHGAQYRANRSNRKYPPFYLQPVKQWVLRK